uniref:Uncharacterized protein n=1 Tax=Wuchereria bancrofti TaxID=6293 RepID=A0A1I8EWC6_WUCBA
MSPLRPSDSDAHTTHQALLSLLIATRPLTHRKIGMNHLDQRLLVPLLVVLEVSEVQISPEVACMHSF